MKFRMIESEFPVHLLRYDPETGWIHNLAGNRVGSFGAASHHYETVCIKRNRILSHRIAWRLMTGEWPKSHIDHKDGNHRNNRWDNLRLASPSQNVCNRLKQKTNTSGTIGVYMDKSVHKWRVNVCYEGTRVQNNVSHSISAVVASRLIRRVLHGEFSSEARQDAQLRQHASLTYSRAIADLYDDGGIR